MTETRKAIMSLISEHMAKDLSEGCLVEIWNHKAIYLITQNSIVDYNVWNYTIFHWWEDIEDVTDKIWKIIWHYDITAVLKYIKINGGKINMQEKTDWNAMYIKVEYLYLWDDDYDYYHIPNKPLHLYTEQEEKDLLELLLKLKN
jgi:hypothetical protein